jgi:hypothetical protein
VFWVAFFVWRLLWAQVRVQEGEKRLGKVGKGVKRFRTVQKGDLFHGQRSASSRKSHRFAFFIVTNMLPAPEKRAIKALSVSLGKFPAPIFPFKTRKALRLLIAASL